MNAVGNQSANPNVLECIEMRHWQQAIDAITVDPRAVYTTNSSNTNRRMSILSTSHDNDQPQSRNRLPIHELCKIASLTTSVRFSKDEFSDDEEDEEDEEHHHHNHHNHNHHNPQHNHNHGHSHHTSEDDAAALDKIFEACELEEGNKIYEVTQYMIDVSHSLGPMKVSIPREANGDDESHHDLENDDRAVPLEQRFIPAENDDSETGAAENDENLHHDRTACPLHTTCTTGVHESILTVKDSLGKTPLHILCENSCDSSMMRVILESTREATGNLRAPTALSLILAKDANGSTPLHYLAYSRDCPFSSLKLMMDYCQPRWASHPTDDTSDDGEDEEKKPAATSAFRWIDPTLCTDKDGETPLHWALDGYMSSRRVQELTRHSLDAIMIRNKKRKRPFDTFTTNFVDSDWTEEHDTLGQEAWQNVQEYLRVIHGNYKKQKKSPYNPSRSSSPLAIVVEPGSPSRDDSSPQQDSSDGWLPLHFIAGAPYDFPPIFVDLALKYHEGDLEKPDENGKLPLHLACGRIRTRLPDMLENNKTPEETTEAESTTAASATENKTVCTDESAVATKLLKRFPRASVMKVESTNQLALHLAVQTQKPMSLIKTLIRTNPRSLNIQDPVTKLWPFVLAGARDIVHLTNAKTTDADKKETEALSVSFSLLRADPSVLHLVKKRPRLHPMTENHHPNSYGRLSDEDTTSDESSYMEHNSRRIRRLTIRDD